MFLIIAELEWPANKHTASFPNEAPAPRQYDFGGHFFKWVNLLWKSHAIPWKLSRTLILFGSVNMPLHLRLFLSSVITETVTTRLTSLPPSKSLWLLLLSVLCPSMLSDCIIFINRWVQQVSVQKYLHPKRSCFQKCLSQNTCWWREGAVCGELSGYCQKQSHTVH